MCISVRLAARLLIIGSMMWCDVDPIGLVKEVLQPLYGSYSQYH